MTRVNGAGARRVGGEQGALVGAPSEHRRDKGPVDGTPLLGTPSPQGRQGYVLSQIRPQWFVAALGRLNQQRVGAILLPVVRLENFQVEPLGIEPLRQRGVHCETIDTTAQARLDAAIRAVMEGRDDKDDAEAARGAVAMLRARGVQSVVLGCTRNYDHYERERAIRETNREASHARQ